MACEKYTSSNPFYKDSMTFLYTDSMTFLYTLRKIGSVIDVYNVYDYY